MKAAIYSRKSRFTGKGESTQNQIQICKKYANTHFNIEEFIIYEDEGFSGGNLNRPEYQRMIHDVNKSKYDILICYRLDRISRNISNFSHIIEILEKNNIPFVSVREQFDTSTSMGNAMMYIASVFAQLERETTAERIRDNMLELSKSGRWLGGVTPTGFTSKTVTSIIDEKEANYHRLSPVEDELNVVRLIFNKYIELKSLSKLNTYCVQNNIKTKNGNDYTRFSLKRILSNPVYVIADKRLYEYFISNNYRVFADKSHFNGQNGIIAYNKTFQTKHKSNKPKKVCEWIIAIGAHKGVISGDKWIRAQTLLYQNKSKTFRKVQNDTCLLSGLLKCGKCGSYMRPKYGRTLKNGEKACYYMCELKEKSKKLKCNIKNANGNKLDKLFIEEIKRMTLNASNLYANIKNDKISIETTQSSLYIQIETTKKNIINNEIAISNLIATQSQEQSPTVAKYIMDKIEELNMKTTKLKERLYDLSGKVNNYKLKHYEIDTYKNLLENFPKLIDRLDPVEQRNYITNYVNKVIWDGENITIVL